MRQVEAATKTAFDGEILPLAVILSLDIADDPLYCWSGHGDLTFGPGETGDPSLDGQTFVGTGDIIDISNISEGIGGSDALEISMPGVSLDEPLLRQLIRDRRRWQFKRAVVWLLVLDPDTLDIVGKPFRIKTGRIDKMPFKDNGKSGTIKCVIEGQQSYGNIPLGSRYSEQFDLNPLDTSQKYVHSLANMNATIGKKSYPGGVGGGGKGSGLPIEYIVQKILAF